MEPKEIGLKEVGVLEPQQRFVSVDETVEFRELSKDIESLQLVATTVVNLVKSSTEQYMITRLIDYHNQLNRQIEELILGLELSRLVKFCGSKTEAAIKIRSLLDELGK